ncbi:MAG: alpha/beta hydrolase [Chloroflexota bacterium]|nr:MAG: alpha/beta hydrolase [Chloroflexota bacterium]
MPLINLNDQQLFYAARALDRRPVILLIHGAAGSHLDWPPQLRFIEGMGDCAVDLPGHGRSAKPGRASVSAYADDVLALVETLNLTEIVIVGHSMGGAIAMEIALRRPVEIVALVLVATGARLRVNETILDLVTDDYEQVVEFVTALAWGEDAPPETVGRGRAMMMECDPTAVEQDYMACNDFDVMADIGSLTIPTLVLTGSEDQLTPPKYGRFLAENIPGAEYVAIDDAGHMLAQERPDEVAHAIIDFTRRRLKH